MLWVRSTSASFSVKTLCRKDIDLAQTNEIGRKRIIVIIITIALQLNLRTNTADR